jgi:hypothetical protein
MHTFGGSKMAGKGVAFGDGNGSTLQPASATPNVPIAIQRNPAPSGRPNTRDKLRSFIMLGFVSFIPLFDGIAVGRSQATEQRR